MKAKTIEDVNEIISKHMDIHKGYLMVASLTDNDEDKMQHSSALATLKMLKMEMDGEKEW